jgi:hypothetical protein
VALPPVYPVLLVVVVTVALAPEVSPEIVNCTVEPDGLPFAIDPELTAYDHE